MKSTISRKFAVTIRTTIGVLVAAALALPESRPADGRGCGAHPSSYHGGNYGQSYHGPEGGTAYHGAGGGTAYHSPEGGTAYHNPDGETTYHGTGGGTAYHNPGGGTRYYGAGGGTAYHSPDAGTVYRGPGGATGYSNAHAALPTDAGYDRVAGGTAAPTYAANHQTMPMNPNLNAATGAAIRNSYGSFGAQPTTWAATGWTAGQAWAAPTWSAVGASLGYAPVAQPMPYNYGTNITYQGDQVYSGDQPLATADQYYQQAATLAQTAPAADPNADDWTPLGVFALVQKDQSDPHYILQLAINRSGTLAGNYSDLVSGTTLPIQGAVDKKAQRVAWIVGNNKNTVGETGIYNLTQDEAPALIHIGKDKTQQWLLVRLKQPPQQSPSQ